MKQKATWGNPRRHPGRLYKGQTWGIPGPRPGVIWPPMALLFLLFHSLLSLSRKTQTHISHLRFRCSCSRFSISLLSPSFLLRFGVIDLWYVTPPIIQVEFFL